MGADPDSSKPSLPEVLCHHWFYMLGFHIRFIKKKTEAVGLGLEIEQVWVKGHSFTGPSELCSCLSQPYGSITEYHRLDAL